MQLPEEAVTEFQQLHKARYDQDISVVQHTDLLKLFKQSRFYSLIPDRSVYSKTLSEFRIGKFIILRSSGAWVEINYFYRRALKTAP